MINLSALSTATNAAIGLSNLIIATPEDIGIVPEVTGQQTKADSFKFDYYGDQSIELRSDITDHFIEDNTSLQDHIALPPELIRGHGFVAELKDFIPDAPAFLKQARDKLTTISAYTPQISITALIAYNTAVQVYQVAKLATSALVSRWGSLAGNKTTTIGSAVFSDNLNEQQKAFQKFYGYYKKRVLFKVQTPWAIFEHCAIESLKFTQGADSVSLSDVEVVFKPIRFAETLVSDLNGNIVGGEIVSADSDPVTGLGASTGLETSETPSSLLGGL
jgi:hypothetical protein